MIYTAKFYDSNGKLRSVATVYASMLERAVEKVQECSAYNNDCTRSALLFTNGLFVYALQKPAPQNKVEVYYPRVGDNLIVHELYNSRRGHICESNEYVGKCTSVRESCFGMTGNMSGAYVLYTLKSTHGDGFMCIESINGRNVEYSKSVEIPEGSGNHVILVCYE